MFRRIHRPNIFASNNIIRCLGKSESPRDGLKLYASMCRTNMLHPNNYTYPFVLQACSNALGVVEGVQVHAHIVKLGFEGDVFIRNSLIHFYTACCETDMSRRVFDESPQCRDVVTWNVILASYAKDERIDMMEDLFEEMPERDVISWSTMIMGYVQVGELETGLKCFREMRGKGLNFNEAILVTALSACAQLGLLEQGQFVHSSMNSLKFPMSVSIGAGLIDMYAKCGCIEMSKKVFSEMPRRDVWAWNVMINGLAMHGFGKEAVSLFKRFIREGLSPSNVTFVGILNACSRAGLVNDGRHYFKLMREIYGIEPEMEHYGCMVDLLGRAGFVSEGLELIEKMLIKPDPVVWATLLAACKIHGLVELGETIGEKLIQLDPTHDGNYVLLANIYAKSKKWGDVIRVRRLMVDRGATKVAGWSLIEAEGKTHKFIAGIETTSGHRRFTKNLKRLKADCYWLGVQRRRDIVTWNAILASCAREERIDVVEDLFKEIPDKDVISLEYNVNGLHSRGEIRDGNVDASVQKSVKEMPQRDVWSWNVMISGLAMHGFGKEAISLFKRFIREGFRPSNWLGS
ncbi:hypothetical protein GIB67_037092 [Kingdonia uniflora]|uniref:Chlororespiratory reduction 4 n=1 Tax=Kingdonia uniflora TaxID=39325 RepID=A0A7J7LI40_9MAGN|nr:hypothetical protein GIB67_037092 [Kingdonia uniflora]